MAHVVLRPMPDRPGATQLSINGVDYSHEALCDPELVSVGDDPNGVVGFRVTFIVGRLDLGDEEGVDLPDRVPEVAERVRQMLGGGY